MNNYQNVVLLCIFFIAASTTIVPVVSARFATPEGLNAGIENGDTVFLGERNVNFSAFEYSEKGELRQMVRKGDEGEPTDPIRIVDNVATSIPRGIKVDVPYYPVYLKGGNFTRFDEDGPHCEVQDIEECLGDLKVKTYDTDVQPTPAIARPGTIPYTMGVQFFLPDSNIRVNEFNGPWYEYELEGNFKTSEVVNLDGDVRTLKPLSENPAREDRHFAFTFADQDAVGRDCQATMTFRMILNGLDYEHTYIFDVQDYSLHLQLDKTTTERGKELTLTLHGIPFTQYEISLPEGENFPIFLGGWDHKISDSTVIAHPDWDGTVDLRIVIPRTAPITEYSVQARDPDTTEQPVSVNFAVTAPSGSLISLIFNKPQFDEYPYALGDVVKLQGSCKNIDTKVPIYLYVTGPNLPPNGASLTDPRREVVDGDPSTFTVTTYDPILNRWEYSWWTSYYARTGCVAETYTVHANFDPIGYINSAPDGEGSFMGDAPPAWEVPLNEPTLHVRFHEDTGSAFARGDHLYSWWHARGSPGLKGPISRQGHLKWYIFGDNFRYADFDAKFPIYPDKSSSGSSMPSTGGGDNGIPTGVYGFNYGRNFTYGLSPGEYYIVYQHPGRDNRFALLPENDPFFRGEVNEIVGQDGGITTVRLGSLEARAAAVALTEALDSPSVDDIYVMDTFTIEEPSIVIAPPGNVVVGDKLKVKGRSNLACQDKAADKVEVGDRLALTISRLDQETGHKGNTAMKTETVYTYPSSKLDPLTGMRSFAFDEVETSSWYPGQYLIIVECRDARYKNTASFELVGEGVRRETTEVAPSTDPALSDHETPVPYETEVWATPALTTAPPTPQQSSGPLPVAACAVLLAALALFRRR